MKFTLASQTLEVPDNKFNLCREDGFLTTESALVFKSKYMHPDFSARIKGYPGRKNPPSPYYLIAKWFDAEQKIDFNNPSVPEYALYRGASGAINVSLTSLDTSKSVSLWSSSGRTRKFWIKLKRR